MSALALARQRQDWVRELTDKGTLALMAGDLEEVEKLARVCLRDLGDTYIPFRPDHVALDAVTSLLAVAGAWCKVHGVKAPAGLKGALERATALRMRWLEGDE